MAETASEVEAISGGVEASVNGQSGSNIGVAGQLHICLDPVFPTTGKRCSASQLPCDFCIGG
jgi:hypothetical protein